MRIEAGYTQMELGRLAGIHSSHISRMEAGKRTHPAPSITKRLAKALGCPARTLLDADCQVGVSL